VRLSREQLMIFLNTLYYEGAESVEVAYPPVDLVYTIDLKQQLLHVIDRKEYGRRRSEFISQIGEEYHGEIPTANAIKQCLYLAGVLPPRNLSDIEETLRSEARRDLICGERPLLVGFDTNALWDRVNRHIQRIVEEHRLTAGFCISSLLDKELYNRYDRKLEPRGELPEPLGFMENFANQPVYSARAPRLGAVEYYRLKGFPHTIELRGELGGNADVKIIESYESLQTNYDLVIVSADNNFRGLAQSRGMKTLHPLPPHDAPETLPINWEGACELIYVAAVLFGYINVNGNTVEGVWRGKTPEEWNLEQLTLHPEKRTALTLEKHLRIITSAQT
jgi:hypothetical protein